jgi:hypothetical protein
MKFISTLHIFYLNKSFYRCVRICLTVRTKMHPYVGACVRTVHLYVSTCIRTEHPYDSTCVRILLPYVIICVRTAHSYVGQCTETYAHSEQCSQSPCMLRYSTSLFLLIIHIYISHAEIQSNSSQNS